MPHIRRDFTIHHSIPEGCFFNLKETGSSTFSEAVIIDARNAAFQPDEVEDEEEITKGFES